MYITMKFNAYTCSKSQWLINVAKNFTITII